MHSNTLIYRVPDPEILSLVDQYNNDPRAILEIYHRIQERKGGITSQVAIEVAQALGIPPERAFGVASFYSMLSISPTPGTTLRICDGLACWLQGANELLALSGPEVPKGWQVMRTSCLGLCDRAPAALIGLEACGPLEVERLSELYSGWRGEQPSYAEPRPGELRNMLSLAGRVDPHSIQSALKHGAYQSLKKSLKSSGERVITEIELAGLRGRGGAGFPAGRKWRFVAEETRFPKYIVCNADESEPLVFKDRVLIETNPHLILEGMALAAYAIDAREGFIYIRGEYEAQAALLENAILQAEEQGLLGDAIDGTDFSFHVHLHRGAGAYICGEETALLESLEGRRGEPRVRPPYPNVHGFRGYPTIVNNVETFAAVPGIIGKGAEWYRSLGSPQQPGTKLYTLLGHINRPGLFEAPFGLTLNQIIEQLGEGMRPGSVATFALTGGAAGTIVPSGLFDVPLDYDSQSRGISLGAGAILICDQRIPVTALLREVMSFFEVESCGKCTPCRIGTQQARMILDRVVAEKASQHDLQHLKSLADVLENASFCGLGQFAALPLKTGLEHYEAAFS